ncbi:MAG TPA: ABC transporter permease [bacterium]|nr:ABC transporter permease [bacterium]
MRFWHTGRTTRAAALVLAAIIVAVIGAPVLARISPFVMNIPVRLRGPSPAHVLGTDGMGRDVWARMLFGGRLSLTVGLVAVAIEFALGTAVGVMAGYAGGWLDLIVMRLTDIMLGMPGLILALFVVALLGPGLFNVMIALGIGGTPGVARLVRGVTLGIRERDYVQGAVAVGLPPVWIALRYLLPNALPPVLALVTLDTGTIILAAAGLSFIGLGAQPPSPEWGAMLSDAQKYFPNGWWLSVFPGLAITVVVLCLNIVGDAVRDVLDPHLFRGAR